MDIMQAIENRHSVRDYLEKRIEADILSGLNEEVALCNRESGLNIQLITEEPKAFDSFMAHYGKFSHVTNYFALIGKKGPQLDETAGYYGEQLVLKAQQLGLNTCWVAQTFSKRKSRCVVKAGEKLVCVIALGYGKTQGVPHKSKPLEKLYEANGKIPDWFLNGMKAAQLAPTAINQQKFLFTLSENKVFAKATGGVYSKVDLGIVKKHFEIGAGAEQFEWAGL